MFPVVRSGLYTLIGLRSVSGGSGEFKDLTAKQSARTKLSKSCSMRCANEYVLSDEVGGCSSFRGKEQYQWQQ